MIVYRIFIYFFQPYTVTLENYVPISSTLCFQITQHGTPTNKAFAAVDTQKYVLRQRRTRVWGCASVACGSNSQEEFECAFKRVLTSMQSDVRFTMEDTFQQDLPREELPEGRLKKLVDNTLKTYQVPCLQ